MYFRWYDKQTERYILEVAGEAVFVQIWWSDIYEAQLAATKDRE